MSFDEVWTGSHFKSPEYPGDFLSREDTKSNFEAYKEVWYVQDTILSCQYKTLCEGVNEGYYVRFI